MSTEATYPRIPDCPGLKRPCNASPTWADGAGTVHDLLHERLITFEEAAADPQLADIGFGTAGAVADLVKSLRLYPYWEKNERVKRVFACALPDFRRRQFGAQTRTRRVA